MTAPSDPRVEAVARELGDMWPCEGLTLRGLLMMEAPDEYTDVATVVAWAEDVLRKAARAVLAASPPTPSWLDDYLRRQIEWSRATFGAGKRTGGVTQHIEKECAEVRADPTDLSEWIDIIILALDGYWRAGGDPADVEAMLEAKLAKNRARKWPAPISEDHAVEHDRSQDAPPAPSWPAPQPIETAPRDGTEILAWCREYGWISIVAITQDRWPWRDRGEGEYRDDAFTHWLPLPPAPEGER